MESWKKVALLLCGFGLLKEFRPSEPYVTPYLNNPPMNFTDDQINTDIYPVSIYSSMILLIIIFLITDLVRYKPIIILSSITATTMFTMLLVCRSLFAIQIVEALYGLFISCDVAYYTYMYAKVESEHYQIVTGYTRAAYLVGRAISGVVGQSMISAGYSYMSLIYITVGGSAFSFVWAVLLPPVKKSIYFHTDHVDPRAIDGPPIDDSKRKTSFLGTVMKGCLRIKHHFLTAFTNLYVVKWVIWYALATCAYYQVLTYIQPLWEQIIKESLGSQETPDQTKKLNGAVEAIYALTGAGAAYLFGLMKVDWKKHGETALCLCSISLAVFLIVVSQTYIIWIAYAGYILYAIIFNGIFTIASSEIAKYICVESHGLIFGIGLFLGLVFQSILTLIVVDVLSFDARAQFVTYGSYFGVIGIVFGLKAICTYLRPTPERRKSITSVT